MALAPLHCALLGGLLSVVAGDVSSCPGEARFAPTHSCDKHGNFKVCAKLLDAPGSSNHEAWGAKDYFEWIKAPDPSSAVSMMQGAQGDHACVSLWTVGNLMDLAGCDNIHILCAATDVDSILSMYATKAGMDSASSCLKKLCPPATVAPVTTTQASLAASNAATPDIYSTLPPLTTAAPGLLPQPEGLQNQLPGSAATTAATPALATSPATFPATPAPGMMALPDFISTAAPSDASSDWLNTPSDGGGLSASAPASAPTPAPLVAATDGITIPGLNGVWFTSPSTDTSCNELCPMIGATWSFDIVASQHKGDQAGQMLHPEKKGEGKNVWKSVECSSNDNDHNWAADGNTPDGDWKDPGCYVNCACKQAVTAAPVVTAAPTAAAILTPAPALPVTTPAPASTTVGMTSTGKGVTSTSTAMTAATNVGDKDLPVASTIGFSVGRDVVVDRGSGQEETGTIASFGSLTLMAPLMFPHAAGVSIEQLVEEGATTLPPMPVTNALGAAAPAAAPAAAASAAVPLPSDLGISSDSTIPSLTGATEVGSGATDAAAPMASMRTTDDYSSDSYTPDTSVPAPMPTPVPIHKRPLFLVIVGNVLCCICFLCVCSLCSFIYLQNSPYAHRVNQHMDQHLYRFPTLHRHVHNLRNATTRNRYGQPGYGQQGMYGGAYGDPYGGGGYGGQQGMYGGQYAQPGMAGGGYGQDPMGGSLSKLQGGYGGGYGQQPGSFNQPGSFPGQQPGSFHGAPVSGNPSYSGGGYGPAPPPDAYNYNQRDQRGGRNSPRGQKGFRHDAYRNPGYE